MKSLLMKDILAQKPNVILGALYSLIFFVALGLMSDGPVPGFTYVFCGVAVGYTLLLGSFKLDTGDTPRFMFSLPISRTTAVNEKFVLLVVGTIYGSVCAMVFGAVFSLPAIGLVDGLVRGHDLLRIVSGMLMLSFFIPLYFRVGHTIIRYVLVIGLVVLVAGQVAGMLVLSLTDGPRDSLPFLDVLFGWMTGKGTVRQTLIFLAAGAGIGTVSYVASHLIWRRREI